MTRTITREDLKLQLAQRDFDTFLDHVKVESPPSVLAGGGQPATGSGTGQVSPDGTVAPAGPGSLPEPEVGETESPGGQAIPFVKWDHLKTVIEALPNHPSIVWLKARQIGASWALAAYALWTGMYHEGARVLLFSQGEDEAKKLLGKAKFIYDNLPPALRRRVVADNTKEMRFRKEGWYIQALPSTAKAGRSETATLVIFDEADFHEYLDQAYGAVKPTVADAGGQIILVSTANAYAQDSTFKRIYRQSPANGFLPLFFPWNARPHRDQAWYDRERLEYDDPFQFEKEYPDTDDQALSPPAILAAFDHQALDAMRQDLRQPLETDGPISVYQEFSPGKRYIAATDTSHGVGADYSVTVVVDTQTGYVVADILNNTLPPTELTYYSIRMLKRYDCPVWSIEDNDWGRGVIDAAIQQGYPSLYWRDDNTVGWHTGAERFTIWEGLRQAVRQRGLIIPNQQGLKQFYDVIRNPDKGGRMEAIQGRNDDYPMALAIAWACRHQARRSRERERQGGDANRRWRRELFGEDPGRSGTGYKW